MRWYTGRLAPESRSSCACIPKVPTVSCRRTVACCVLCPDDVPEPPTFGYDSGELHGTFDESREVDDDHNAIDDGTGRDDPLDDAEEARQDAMAGVNPTAHARGREPAAPPRGRGRDGKDVGRDGKDVGRGAGSGGGGNATSTGAPGTGDGGRAGQRGHGLPPIRAKIPGYDP